MARAVALGVCVAAALVAGANAQHKIKYLRPNVPTMDFVSAGNFMYYVLNGA